MRQNIELGPQKLILELDLRNLARLSLVTPLGKSSSQFEGLPRLHQSFDILELDRLLSRLRKAVLLKHIKSWLRLGLRDRCQH